MSTTAPAQGPITFERFWKWVMEHPGCVIRVGGLDTVLFDHEDLHWEFFDDDEGNAVVQLLKGKHLVAELIIARQEVVMVQASLDLENPTSGHWTFELMGQSNEDGQGMYQFVMAHGMEQPGHVDLKH